MSLISPNFDVKLIIFSQFWLGAFSQNCWKKPCTGFIRVREMSGKFEFFQGQGIVREFYVVSVKNRYLLKCQGNVREFYNFSLYQLMRNRKLLGQFS